MKTSNQDTMAIKLGYAIVSRLNRRCVRRDEMRIDAAIAATLAQLDKRKRLLGQFNRAVCDGVNNVASRLNSLLCALDSVIESLTQRAHEIETQGMHDVHEIKEPRIVCTVSNKGRKHKRKGVLRLVCEREQTASRTVHVVGAGKHMEHAPKYLFGAAPLVSGQYIGSIPIVQGLTGYNEINPKSVS